MPNCPNCNSRVSVKFSDHVVYPACKRRLIATFTPFGKLLLAFILIVECVIVFGVSVVAGSINYPFVSKWLIYGSLLFGILIVTLLLLFSLAKIGLIPPGIIC